MKKEIKLYYYIIGIQDFPFIILISGYLGPKATTSEGYDRTFLVNYLSHFLLTNCLLNMRNVQLEIEVSPFRIINLTSDSYKLGRINFEDIMSEKHFDIYSAYGQSKLAILLFSRELARRHAPREVMSVAVHPGEFRIKGL